MDLPTAPHDPATASALAALGEPIALFAAFARRPERAHAIAAWGRYYFSRQVSLTLRARELIIDRTTALCAADYEWGVHIAAFAAKADLDDRQIASLAGGEPSDPCWSDPADAAVLRAVDELHATHDLADATWQELIAAVGEEGALDLILVCGWYHAISFAVRALRLGQEPGTPDLAAAGVHSTPDVSGQHRRSHA